MLVVWRKLTPDEIREDTQEIITKIQKWFEDNPKRRVCRAELWYERGYTIKRKDAAGQINAIAEKLIAEQAQTARMAE